MFKNICFIPLFLPLTVMLTGQTTNIPASPQGEPILLLGATAHLGNGEVIENAAIGFAGGKLTLVADATTVKIDRSTYGQVVDLEGRHIYPGFILTATELGLVEVNSIADTDDSEEGGRFNPSSRAIIAYNTDSELIPTMRFNGILMAQATLQGGGISGNSSVVQLDAWNWEDAVYRSDDAKAMVAAVNIGKQHGIDQMTIVGGAEAMLIKDFLKENGVAVILSNIHSIPEQDHEDTVYPFKLPAMLHEAGVELTIAAQTGMTGRSRNLPFLVGTAIAYGLPYEEGVKAVTATPARLLGIEDRCGTLEAGKDATLFVSTGDAFDMRTNQVEHAFIQGRSIQLEGTQQFLYQKYGIKYGHKVD